MDMKNLDWNIYTYRHRRAFAYCVSRLIHDPVLKQEMLKRAEVHDMDKMLMYLFLDQHTAQLLHVQRQPHHLENSLPRSYEDLVETVIDYECAPYTKQDKPLNAYDFVLKLHGMHLLNDETMNSLMSIMRELNIDHSGTVSEDTEGLAYIAGLGEVTEEMVLEEILTYIRNHPDNELEWVLEQAHSGIRL
ncbi:MAG: hypothetical protein IKF00_11705 [Solobacterium sp.]|nr:hypothetical protein [Solobacterium sp.]